ncbi:MAG TPA: hypothetical protein VEI03_07800 [Stellaceae bacterium]|nr:hypothetical protein [Stellaceae bacterium]
MLGRLEQTSLPAYGHDATALQAPACYVSGRSAQYFDDDLAGCAGSAQKQVAKGLSGPGDGANLLFMSRSKDVVLVGTPPTPARRKQLFDDADALSLHWNRCGIDVGHMVFSDNVEADARRWARDHFLCSPIFSTPLLRVFGADAAALRDVVRLLMNKSEVATIVGDPSVRTLSSAAELRAFTAGQGPPWVLKAAVGAGGRFLTRHHEPDDAKQGWRRAKSSWKQVVGQRFIEGDENFAFYLIDPAAEGPKLLLHGTSDNRKPPFYRNIWSRNSAPAANEAAQKIFEYVRKRTKLPLVIGQDLKGRSSLVVDTNPRWCAYVPMLRLTAARGADVGGVKYLVAPRPKRSLGKIVAALRKMEFRSGASQGVVLCAAPVWPRPVLTALVVNDVDDRLEESFRRVVS